MADANKQGDFDIFIAQSIYPEATSIFTSQLKSLEEIKDDCYIVLDTNVLLILYTTGEEDLLDQCRKTYTPLVAAKRLIVPGQVAREFAKLRPEKLGELYQQISLKKQFKQLQKGKYPLLSSLDEYKEVVRLEGEIDKKVREYQKAVDKVLAHIKGWEWNDPVSLLYREIFSEDAIVDIPINEEEVKQDLQRRQQHHIPPGYKDSGKDDAGVGDLLIWYTILEIGKTRKKSVIFVSGEEKADWYTKSEGQPLYPRYELVDEFRRRSGGQTFQIVKFSRFLELYGASKQVVEELRKEESLSPSTTRIIPTSAALVTWRGYITSALREVSELWAAYGNDSEKLIDPYLSQLQSRFLYISSVLSRAISDRPEFLSEDVLFELRDVANKLADLGSMQFYTDDGESINNFNNLGKRLLRRTNMAIINLALEEHKKT
jgi:rRNA-processing protein FCF1